MMLRSLVIFGCFVTVSLANAGPYAWFVEDQLTQGKELRLQLEGVAALKSIDVTIQSATGEVMWNNTFKLLGQETAIFPLWMPPTETPDGTYTCLVQGEDYQQILAFLLYGHLEEESIPKAQELAQFLTTVENQMATSAWAESFAREYRELAVWVRNELMLQITAPTGSQPFDQYLGLIDQGLKLFSEMGIRRRGAGYKAEREIVQRLSLSGSDYTFTRPWVTRYSAPDEKDITPFIDPATNPEGWIPVELPCNLYQALPFSWHISNPNDYMANRVLDWIEDRAWWFRTTVLLSESHLLAETGGELIVEGANGSLDVWIDGQPISESRSGVYPIPATAADDEQITFVLRFVPQGASASDKKSEILRRLTTTRMPPDKENRPDPTLRPQLDPLGILGNVFIRPVKAVQLLSYSMHPVAPEKDKPPQMNIALALDNQTGREGSIEFRLTGSTTPRVALVLEERKIPEGRSLQSYQLILDSTYNWMPGLEEKMSEYVPGNLRGTETRNLVIRERFPFSFSSVGLGTDPLGRSAVVVNGKPISVRGAKWYGIDASGYWKDPEAEVNRLERLLDLAMYAEFNTLWVIREEFEPDDFYSACDERGLMVWQRINPPESAWAELQPWLELLQKRIQGHPCLVGLETSPTLSKERKAQLVEALKKAQLPLLIDTFPWKEIEIATPALPHENTIKQFAGVFGTWPPIVAWKYHGTDPTWMKSLSKYANLTNAVSETQEIQAEQFQETMAKVNAAGPIMDGMMFGRFNDPWPCISNSMVDYYGRPKRLYYEVKRWNVPQRMVIRGDDPKQIWIENRTDHEINGVVMVAISRTDADLSARRSDSAARENVRVTVPPWQDQVVYNIERKQIENFDPASNFLYGKLTADGVELMRDIGFWVPREGLVPCQDAFLRLSRGPAKAKNPFVRVRSRGFVDTFWIDDGDLRIIFDDNYFDIADSIATIQYHLVPNIKEIPAIYYGARRIPRLEIAIPVIREMTNRRHNSPDTRSIFGLTIGILFLSGGCIVPQSVDTIPRERRVLFDRLPRVEYSIPEHATYLQGVRICLDPGHGGDAHIPNYKRGPTGVREAEINWRVATNLKQFLERSGADVIVTRHGDDDVSLAERADLANRNQVDFFISMHHNAATPETNYTSTWFHADPDYAPSGLDLARNLHFAVSEIMAVSTALPNGLKSDYLIYPGSGFGVLRQLKVTGCLMESSFHSNPEEEQRLDTPWYNKREAYGYFLGIARYVAGGLPKVTLVSPEPGTRIPTKRPKIELMISDGLRERGGWGSDRNWIFQDDINLLVDGQPVLDFNYDNASGRLTYTPGFDLRNERHHIKVQYRNLFGNNVLPHNLSFIVAPPAKTIELAATPPVMNDDGYSYARLDLKVLDANGLPVADDTPLRITTTKGILESSNLYTRDGFAVTYLGAPAERGAIEITLQSGETVQHAKIPVEHGAKSLVYALILDASNQPIDSAELHLEGHKTQTLNGRGILDLSKEQILGTKSLLVVRPGYFKAEARVEVGRGMSNHITANLYPVMGEVLKDKVFLLDPRYGGAESGPTDSQGRRAADLNLAVAIHLKSLLEAAGAKVHLLRADDSTIEVRTRVQHANNIGIGNYLRVDHAMFDADKDAFSVSIYPSPAGIERGGLLIPAIGSYLDLAGGDPLKSDEDEIKNTKMVANGVLFRTLDQPRTALNPSDPGLVSREAYALFLAYANLFELPDSYRKSLTVRVLDADTARPVPHVTVELDRTLTLTTDARGEVRFEGLAARRYQLRAIGTDGQTADVDVDSTDGEPLKDVRLKHAR